MANMKEIAIQLLSDTIERDASNIADIHILPWEDGQTFREAKIQVGRTTFQGRGPTAVVAEAVTWGFVIDFIFRQMNSGHRAASGARFAFGLPVINIYREDEPDNVEEQIDPTDD